jgi:hypothetical protein
MAKDCARWRNLAKFPHRKNDVKNAIHEYMSNVTPEYCQRFIDKQKEVNFTSFLAEFFVCNKNFAFKGDEDCYCLKGWMVKLLKMQFFK